jgi:syntaxin-binding protein 5
MVRTFEREDVNITSEADLFEPETQAEIDAAATGATPAFREPIFRLAWSGFPQGGFLDRISALASGPKPQDGETDETGGQSNSSGQTMLTVLGGLLPDNPIGVHVIHLGRYAAPVLPSGGPSSSSAIPPVVREALRQSTFPVGHSVYQTPSQPEDFVLVPKSTPHYDMSYDPTAIIISISPSPLLPPLQVPREVRAYSFPPRLDQDPIELPLPAATIWSGQRTVTALELYTVSSQTLRLLAEGGPAETTISRRIFTGGLASPRNGGDPDAIRRAKHAPTRVLVTAHIDFSVRIWGMSDVLLSVPDSAAASKVPEPGMASVFAGRLKHEWPQLLKEFDLRPWFRNPGKERIDRVELATETLEFTCASSSGDVLVFRCVICLGYLLLDETFSLRREATMYLQFGQGWDQTKLDSDRSALPDNIHFGPFSRFTRDQSRRAPATRSQSPSSA